MRAMPRHGLGAPDEEKPVHLDDTLKEQLMPGRTAPARRLAIQWSMFAISKSGKVRVTRDLFGAN